MTIDQYIKSGSDIISKMDTDQRIQLVIAIILAFTAVILAVSLTFILVQVLMQKRLLKAELLRDLFEMYLRLYDNVTEDQIKELHLYHKIYMDDETYKWYKRKDQAIRKYIFMSKRYECLAFIHTLNVDYPATQLLKKWTHDLCEEKEFLDVHKNYRFCYDNYAEFVEELQNAKQFGQD